MSSPPLLQRILGIALPNYCFLVSFPKKQEAPAMPMVDVPKNNKVTRKCFLMTDLRTKFNGIYIYYLKIVGGGVGNEEL